MLNVTQLNQKINNYKKRKLTEYLDQQLIDPLEDLKNVATKKERRKQIKTVAAAVQHYGHLKDSVKKQKLTELYNHQFVKYLLHNPITLKKERNGKAFEIAYSISHHTIFTKNNIIKIGKFTYKILFFLQHALGELLVYVVKMKTLKDLPPMWNVFLKNDELVETDYEEWFNIQEIDSLVENAKISPLRVKHNSLVFTNSTNECIRMLSESYVNTYILIENDKYIMEHPLVKQVVKYLNITSNTAKEKLYKLIVKKFKYIHQEFLNDKDKEEIDCTIYHRLSKNEQMCTICELTKSIVSQTKKYNICEPCYIKLKEVFRIFIVLEVYRQKKINDEHISTNSEYVQKTYPIIEKILNFNK